MASNSVRYRWPPSRVAQRSLQYVSEQKNIRELLEQYPWLESLTTKSAHVTARVKLGDPWTDKYLRCVSDEHDLPRALLKTAEFSREQLRLLAHPKGRGEALALGIAAWKRLQTDGPYATVLAFVLAALWAFDNRIDLRHNDVSREPFNVQILKAYVLQGLFQQKEDCSFVRGPKLEAWAATAKDVPGAADLVTCGRDSVLLAGLDSKDCNNPGCKFGGVRDQGTIDQLRNEKQRKRYGAATVAEALEACGALSYLCSPFDLFCQNRVFSNEYGKMIQAALDDPQSPGLVLQLQDPQSGAILYVSV
jgi:hypothetical protein